jgi:hypothetical protein
MYPTLRLGGLSVSNYVLLGGLGMAVGMAAMVRLATEARLSLRRFLPLLVGGHSWG